MLFLSDPFFQLLPSLLRPLAGAVTAAGSGWWRSCRDWFACALTVVMPRMLIAIMGAVLLGWALAMLAVCG